jgi:hypothetical protein
MQVACHYLFLKSYGLRHRCGVVHDLPKRQDLPGSGRQAR